MEVYCRVAENRQAGRPAEEQLPFIVSPRTVARHVAVIPATFWPLYVTSSPATLPVYDFAPPWHSRLVEQPRWRMRQVSPPQPSTSHVPATLTHELDASTATTGDGGSATTTGGGVVSTTSGAGACTVQAAMPNTIAILIEAPPIVARR
jgi:hypothetical protein